MTQKFFLVWNENGRSPTYKHHSYNSAKTEAKRLARINPVQSFHVLEHVGTARKVDVAFYVHEEPVHNRFADNDEMLPF